MRHSNLVGCSRCGFLRLGRSGFCEHCGGTLARPGRGRRTTRMLSLAAGAAVAFALYRLLGWAAG